MAKFRRTQTRKSEFGEAFPQAEWQAGYEFEGIYHKDGISGEPLIEQINPSRIHLASSCEEVKEV